MFEVISKESERHYNVFDVSEGQFLIFANGYFQYQPMDRFYVDVDQYKGTIPPEKSRSRLFKGTGESLEVI